MKKALFTKNNKCFLCPHKCVIPEGRRGVCGVRINKKGVIYSLVYGAPCSLAVDPVEKKPLYHFFPGKKIFSIGTFGCNFKCLGCQNWSIAQNNPEEDADEIYSPEDIVLKAKENGCDMIAYTYTEPTVFYEYVYDISKLAKKSGLKNVIVSNGYIGKEPLEKLCKVIDAANIDLKFFEDSLYIKYSKARLSPVLESLRILKKEGVWLEITNLMIPGINDDMKNFERMCKWIKKDLGKETPLHISRFYPNYKLLDVPITPLDTLRKAKDIAKKYLDYVYIGNVNEESNTYCPKCDSLLIRRCRYHVQVETEGEICKKCGKKLAGMLKK